MKCPKCSSEKKLKAGFTKGKQRNKCKDCGCAYTVELKSTPKPDSLKLKKQALQLYLEGLGFRSTGRLLGVSSVSVLNRIRNLEKKYRDLVWKAKKQRWQKRMKCIHNESIISKEKHLQTKVETFTVEGYNVYSGIFWQAGMRRKSKCYFKGNICFIINALPKLHVEYS
ncbi:Transposase [Bacteroidales bacterium Barb7]|nr:Transposase [Bacteroidales bacterium Barb7]